MPLQRIQIFRVEETETEKKEIDNITKIVGKAGVFGIETSKSNISF